MNHAKIFSSLRKLGLRVTPLKEAILDILEKESRPLSVAEFEQLLKRKRLKPNKTSLYRELETLTENEIVEEVQLHSNVRCFELKDSDDHHHHFVCEECKDIIDFESDEIEELIKKTETKLKRKGASVRNHAINIYGLCSLCK